MLYIKFELQQTQNPGYDELGRKQKMPCNGPTLVRNLLIRTCCKL